MLLESPSQTVDKLKQVLNSPISFFHYVTGNPPTEYQKLILVDSSKNITVRASRQSGKSEVVAVKVLWNVIKYNDFQVLMTAPTQRQANLIYNKIETFVMRTPLLKAITSMTRNYMKFSHTGSTIFTVPGGNEETIRGYSPDLIIVDEAAYVKDKVYNAIEPSLAATDGQIMLISTPFGKQGKFYESHSRLDYYSRYHIPYTECPFISKSFIEREKLNKTEMEFNQEYGAEFIEQADNYFSMELLKELMSDLDKTYEIENDWDYYLGVDQARYGTDETVYIVVRHKSVEIKNPDEHQFMTKEETELWMQYKETANEDGIVDLIDLIYWDFTPKNDMTDVMGRVQALNENFDFRKTYLDAQGLGAGSGDFLKEHGLPIELNMFQQREKHDIYTNLKLLMERSRGKKGIIFRIPDYHKLIWQLVEIQYKYSSNGLMQIHHPDKANAHDDWPDALALAVSFMLKPRGIFTTT